MPKTLWSEAQNTLALELAQARKDSGLSQVSLAKTLRCQQSLIARIESGERRIDLVEFVILCRAIGVEPSHVLLKVAPLIPPDAGL
jgi:ribosome-binding protein aMBF1 (putative translation factor)